VLFLWAGWRCGSPPTQSLFPMLGIPFPHPTPPHHLWTANGLSEFLQQAVPESLTPSVQVFAFSPLEMVAELIQVLHPFPPFLSGGGFHVVLTLAFLGWLTAGCLSQCSLAMNRCQSTQIRTSWDGQVSDDSASSAIVSVWCGGCMSHCMYMLSFPPGPDISPLIPCHLTCIIRNTF